MLPSFRDDKLDRAWRLLARWTEEDQWPAVAAAVGDDAGIRPTVALGRQTAAGEGPPASQDSIFLIASPTKPIAALAVLLLAERGELRLGDPVQKFLPDFNRQGKGAITLAHCLTHTSGLPDMPPDNAELRARGAPLSDFLASARELKPAFLPGRGVQYQSMGFLLLGEVVHQVTGKRLPDFLRSEVFAPLGMRDTALGVPREWEQPGAEERVSRIAELRLPEAADPHSNVWNTPYWRRLGAPWGGLLSTAGDLAKLCGHLLAIHRGDDGIVGRPTLEAATVNQLASMPHVPETARRCQPWGYGWRLNWPNDPQTFGDLLSPAAYGHWGATGTMVWIDPARRAFAVMLTTQPLDFERGKWAHFSNAVCAALR